MKKVCTLNRKKVVAEETYSEWLKQNKKILKEQYAGYKELAGADLSFSQYTKELFEYDKHAGGGKVPKLFVGGGHDELDNPYHDSESTSEVEEEIEEAQPSVEERAQDILTRLKENGHTTRLVTYQEHRVIETIKANKGEDKGTYSWYYSAPGSSAPPILHGGYLDERDVLNLYIESMSFSKGGKIYTDKREDGHNAKYWVKNEDGQWTVFSESDKWKKRDEFEGGLASEKDATYMAKLSAGVLSEADPEEAFMKNEFSGGGIMDSRISLLKKMDAKNPSATLKARIKLLEKMGKKATGIEVALGAEPNPDYDRGSHEGTVSIDTYRVKAKDIQEARDKVVAFIDENDLGSGNFNGGELYSDGKQIGYISYNGRVWDMDDKPMVYKSEPTQAQEVAKQIIFVAGMPSSKIGTNDDHTIRMTWPELNLEITIDDEKSPIAPGILLQYKTVKREYTLKKIKDAINDIVELKKPKSNWSGTDWENDVYEALEEIGEMDRSDAQGVAESAEKLYNTVTESYKADLSAKETAEAILKATEVEKLDPLKSEIVIKKSTPYGVDGPIRLYLVKGNNDEFRTSLDRVKGNPNYNTTEKLFNGINQQIWEWEERVEKEEAHLKKWVQTGGPSMKDNPKYKEAKNEIAGYLLLIAKAKHLKEQLQEKPDTTNWKSLFASPERFQKYGGEFLYPPRAENKVRPTAMMFGKLDNNTFIAEPKMNGSATSVTIFENTVVVKERHNTFFSTPPTFDFQALHRGKGAMCIVGEFMNKSKKDEDGKAFKGFCIWDITAYEDEILIGSTIEERIKLLDKLYPTKGVIQTKSGTDLLYITETPDIYKVAVFDKGFEKLFNELTKIDMIEGFVLKRKNARLEMMVSEINNSGSFIKLRKATSNYEF